MLLVFTYSCTFWIRQKSKNNTPKANFIFSAASFGKQLQLSSGVFFSHFTDLLHISFGLPLPSYHHHHHHHRMASLNLRHLLSIQINHICKIPALAYPFVETSLLQHSVANSRYYSWMHGQNLVILLITMVFYACLVLEISLYSYRSWLYLRFQVSACFQYPVLEASSVRVRKLYQRMTIASPWNCNLKWML